MWAFGLSRGARLGTIFGHLLVAALIGIATTPNASAQDRRQNAPGEFDFYVLSLSWSPSYCEEVGERGGAQGLQAAARLLRPDPADGRPAELVLFPANGLKNTAAIACEWSQSAYCCSH